MRLLAAAAMMAAVSITAPAAMADPLDLASLKTMAEGMGYAPKPLGDDGKKLVINYASDNFNVPIGMEISNSGRYVWLTANLGESKLTGDLALTLLKRGTDYQPTMFWITSSNNLMIGTTVENHDVTPANMKLVIDKLASDIGKTSDVWQAAAPAPASNPSRQ